MMRLQVFKIPNTGNGARVYQVLPTNGYIHFFVQHLNYTYLCFVIVFKLFLTIQVLNDDHDNEFETIQM